VIFVPAAVGVSLPDGTKHDGFFVVRDRGGHILGENRFDFYSGFTFWASSHNFLMKLGFADKRTRLPFFKIQGSRVNKVKLLRGYPKLPKPIQFQVDFGDIFSP